jgi:hypothetical protein
MRSDPDIRGHLATAGTLLAIEITSPVCPVMNRNDRMPYSNYLATGYVTQRVRAMPLLGHPGPYACASQMLVASCVA